MSKLCPSIFKLDIAPYPTDGVHGPTAAAQRAVEQDFENELCAPPVKIPGVRSDNATTTLNKMDHANFVLKSINRMASGYTSLDASKPWMIYWSLQSLDVLGIAVDRATRDRAVSTIFHCLHKGSAFGGGAANTHIPHLLPTYASVLSLAIAGHPGPGGGWAQLVAARQGIYDFFMSCKSPTGGFVVCPGGEVDVRGVYCLLVVAALLDILTPELLSGVGGVIASCQTYEGGFACASTPTFGGASALQGIAVGEAHGGYTACAVASHFILSAVPTASSRSAPPSIDVDSALRWASSMQGSAADAGGFRGRTNKLVDGCYSWWIGGCFPVLEALRARERQHRPKQNGHLSPIPSSPSSSDNDHLPLVDSDDDNWTDVSSTASDPADPTGLFNRTALQEYILLVAQAPTGGLRDKSSTRPDLYHTANNLSGLSIAQRYPTYSASAVQEGLDAFDSSKSLPAVKTHTADGDWKDDEERNLVRKHVYAYLLGWSEDSYILGGESGRVNTTLPVVNILGARVKTFLDYMYRQA